MPVVVASITGSELPTTVGDLIAATRDHLQGTYQSEWNVLATTMDAPAALTVETLTLAGNANGAVRTAYISIDDELMYVMSNPANNQCQVIRGFDGTIPTVHAAGSLVEVRPRFPRHVIRRQLALEIGSWPGQLFQVFQTSFTLSGDGRTFAYDLGVAGSQVRFLLDVVHAPWFAGRSRNTWPRFEKPPRLNRSVDISAFPSGMALEIKDDMIQAAVECRVTYAAPFNLSSMDDSMLAGAGGIGLATSMLDIPPLGAAARLLGPREALRTFPEAVTSQVDTQQVQGGAALRAGMYLQEQRNQRIKEEISHLNEAWPVRVK